MVMSFLWVDTVSLQGKRYSHASAPHLTKKKLTGTKKKKGETEILSLHSDAI